MLRCVGLVVEDEGDGFLHGRYASKVVTCVIGFTICHTEPLGRGIVDRENFIVGGDDGGEEALGGGRDDSGHDLSLRLESGVGADSRWTPVVHTAQ